MKISKSRIAVVIGKGGETKESIERALGVKINLDSKTGDCEITPDFNNPKYNPLNIFTAQNVVNAINRGFNPLKAMKLMEETYDLDIFNLMSILGKTDKRIVNVKGRVIGRDGEMRKAIEKYAECFISVHGKTISIIAQYENLQVARKAVSMLINGIPHHVVLKFLENKYKEKKKGRISKNLQTRILTIYFTILFKIFWKIKFNISFPYRILFNSWNRSNNVSIFS